MNRIFSIQKFVLEKKLQIYGISTLKFSSGKMKKGNISVKIALIGGGCRIISPMFGSSLAISYFSQYS